MSVGKLVLGALKEAFLLSPPEKQPQEPPTLNGPNRIPGFRPPIDWLNAELERRNPHVQQRREELGLVRDEQTRQLLASPGPAGQATRGADFLTRREGRHHPYDRKGGTAGDGAAGATNNGGAPFRTPGPRVQIDFAGDDPLTTVVTRPPVGSHRPVLGRPGWQQHHHHHQHRQHARPHASTGANTNTSRWTAAASVGSQHRYPSATRSGAGTYQTAADFAAFLAVRERTDTAVPSPDANDDGDSTFERSAMKQAAAASRGRRVHEETEEDREERLAREAAAEDSPVTDALQTRMFTGHYAHGPRPITPFSERGASSERGTENDAVRSASIREAAERTFRAGAERIASATPDMAALHSRAGFRAGYHVAAAAAAAASGAIGSRAPAAAGVLFGGALAPSQLEFRRSSAWKTLGLDVRDVDAYKKLVEASSAGRNRRRPTSAPPDSARKPIRRETSNERDDDDVFVVDDDAAGGAPRPGPAAKGRGKPKKPVTQYRMKAPPAAEVRTAVRRTSLDSFVDDSIENLRRSTAEAEGDVAPTPTAAPVRTALTPSQRRELALEVRAANASVHAPVDVAQEADLERQIAEMEIVARDLESRRAELKSPLKELDGDLEAGPSAADIEAMEAELTRPISAAQAEAIERAHAPGPPSEVIASGTFTGQGALELTRRDVATMATGEWLNDEMVNFTIGAMADREMARCGGTQPRVHFFNTFFVGKLTAQGDGYDYGAVRRWTTRKKLGYDVLECDKVIVPVHQGIHWVLAVVDFKATCVRFYDSLLGDDKGLVEDLLRWVRDEWRNKKNADVDTESWSVEIPKDIPRQMNGCDCGVFMLKYADYIATGCPLTFHQRDMEYFRRRIVADAVEKGN